MTTFSSKLKKRRRLVDDLVKFSCGLDVIVVEKIVTYAECLLLGEDEVICENSYMAQLANQFNLTCSYMNSLIFNAVASNNKYKVISVEEFCKLICIFVSQNLDLKISYVFKVYDTDRDGLICKAEAYSLLKPSVIQGDEEQEESLKDLIEIVMKIGDSNSSGSIDPTEFRNLVKKDVLYIELLGQCLPGDKEVQRFTKKLHGKTIFEVREMFEAELIASGTSFIDSIKNTEFYPIKLEL